MKNKKKLTIIILSVVIAVILICTGTIAYAYDVAKKNSIGLDNALNIAMTDAGVTEENTTVTKAKLDIEKSVLVYEIEFVSGGLYEYDYSIKASDGTIIDKDCESAHDDDDDKANISAGSEANTSQTAAQTAQTTSVLNETVSVQSTTEKATTTAKKSEAVTEKAKTTSKKTGTTAESPSGISLDEAKSIALKDAGVSNSNAKFTSAHKDYDDGTVCYEIEFVTDSYKYEYEIDLNGNIISMDKDPVKNSKTTTAAKASAKYIGVDEAKSIALKSSGVSADSAVFTKAKLEKEDGIYVYEIEFQNGGLEYEYEINASSGKIIKSEHSSIDDDFDD